ncbi:hypothetical protein ABFS83_03G081900 [Erythranthe nasuta]
MEKKTTKSKSKIWRLLPKAAQASLSFQNPPPLSPGRDKRPAVNWHQLKTHFSKGFSGPITSAMVSDDENREPTSPKVSCMGQIKHRNKIRTTRNTGTAAREVKKKPSGLKKIFGYGGGRKSDASVNHGGGLRLPDRAASLSQMRRFASGRGTCANFDRTTARNAAKEGRGFYSDEERGYSDGEDDVIIIPFSAPIFVAGAGCSGGLALEPRKEINLWKRRTMAQPKPLQLLNP